MLHSSGCHWKCWIKPVPAPIHQQDTFQLPILCPENWPLNLAFCFLFINFQFVRLFPPILWQISFSDNLWCGTLSKAFSKLDSTVSVWPPLSTLTDALGGLGWIGETGLHFAEVMQHLFQQTTFTSSYRDFIFIALIAFRLTDFLVSDSQDLFCFVIWVYLYLCVNENHVGSLPGPWWQVFFGTGLLLSLAALQLCI